MNQTLRDRLRAVLLLGVFAAVSGVWLSQAGQQDSTFTGTSFRIDSEGIRLSSRGFEAGARTHWHRHSAQLLFVREGRLRYQVEGQSVGEVGLHESVYLPRGVPHWHGAVPGQALTHVGVTFPDDAGEHFAIEWLDPVGDETYGSGGAR